MKELLVINMINLEGIPNLKSILKIKKTVFATIVLSLFYSILYSQTVINIESTEFAIVLHADGEKRLRQVYFGQKLEQPFEYSAIVKQLRYNGTNEDVFNHAYTPSGTWNIAESALQILHADGNPSTELEYVKHSTKQLMDNVSLTSIDLMDPLYKTEVRLYYKVYQNENVFEQWAEIKNGEDGLIELKK